VLPGRGRQRHDHGLAAILRHGSRSRMMNPNVEVKVVMHLLRHKKLSSTERYVYAADEHCRRVVDWGRRLRPSRRVPPMPVWTCYAPDGA